MNIFQAIKTSNYAAVLEIMRLGSKCLLERKNKNGHTPLHYACYFGSIATVRLLLDRGVNVNVLDTKGRTPLILATVRQNIMIVNMLLSSRADINIRDTIYNRSALHYAVIGNNIHLTRFLCKNGAQIDAQDVYYRSPALYALGRYDFVRLFVEDYGVSPNIYDGEGKSLLYYACKSGELKSFVLLAKHGARNNVVTEKERTLLHAAVKGCNISIIKRLISPKTVNTPDRDGKTPIFFASSVKVAGFLITNDANPNHRDNTGSTPLHYCCNYNICEMLLAFDAHPNLPNNDNHTALHIARQIGNIKIISLLEIYSKMD